MHHLAFEREGGGGWGGISVKMLTDEVIACLICMSILGTNQLINTLLNHLYMTSKMPS